LAAAWAVALACVVGAPWLSASATATTSGACDWASFEEPSPGESCYSDSGSWYSLSDPPCEISAGLYPFPTSGTGSWSLPSWAPGSATSVCVQLGVSSLVDADAEPTTVVVGNWPSDSPGNASLLAAVTSWRDLYLYSVGVLIFLGAALVARFRV
jgi:hypothetical protein